MNLTISKIGYVIGYGFVLYGLISSIIYNNNDLAIISTLLGIVIKLTSIGAKINKIQVKLDGNER